MFNRLISDGYERKFTEFEPEKLQYFDPEIIASFRSECLTSEKHASGPLDLIYRGLQFEDLYLAIKYAETDIIPRIKTKNFTPDDLISWIKQVHVRVATTLALEHAEKAGEYVDKISTQWHPDSRILPGLAVAIAKGNTNLCKENLATLFKKYGFDLPQDLATSFNEIIQKLRKDKNIVVPENIILPQKDGVDESLTNALNLLHKLTYGIHQQFFSKTEEAVIAKIIKVRMLPENLPGAMNAFSKELHKRLLECDGSEVAVAKLAAFAFRELTEIHSFFNGNGRTGSILLNTILIAFGYPSIIMRTAADEKDPDSTYNLAIKHIISDISYLEKHILTRLEAAKKKPKSLSKDIEFELTMRKESLNCIYTLLKENHEHCSDKNFNLEKIYGKETEKLLNKRQKLLDKMKHEQEQIKTPSITQSGVSFEFASKDVIQELERLTGIKGWKKAIDDKGLKIWLPGLDKNAAESLVGQLSETKAMTVELRKALDKDKKTSKPLVWIEQPNLPKLKNVAALNAKPKVASPVVLK